MKQLLGAILSVHTSGSKVISELPGEFLEMQILSPYPDSMNQKLWGQGLLFCKLMIFPDDSDEC